MMEDAFITINGWAALLLISPFVLLILFAWWKELKSRYKMRRGYEKEIRYLEDLVLEGHGALTSSLIGFEPFVRDELLNEYLEFRDVSEGKDPRDPRDLVTDCTHTELFRAKAILKMKNAKKEMNPIWNRRHLEWTPME